VASLFRPTVATYTLPDGKHRTPDGKRVTKDTPGAIRVCRRSTVYFGRYRDANRIVQRVPLCADKTAAKQILAKLVTEAKLAEHNLAGAFEAHQKRPLAEHLEDFRADLLAKGRTAKQVRLVYGRARRIVQGCGFRFISELSASRVQGFLAELEARRPALPAIDPAKPSYTRKELAEALGTTPGGITAMFKRHRLAAEGNGKARRYARAALETLLEKRAKGAGLQTVNFYLAAVKQFCAWLVKDRRTLDNSLAHLKGKTRGPTAATTAGPSQRWNYVTSWKVFAPARKSFGVWMARRGTCCMYPPV
jgi:hypothetical protein